MVSNLKATKFYFEKMFLDKWTDTPIHFVGQEFDATGKTTWINPMFAPLSGTLAALSGRRTKMEGSLNVICWASNDVDVFELGDKIIDFIHNNAKEFNVNGFEINDHQWDNSNMVYLYLTFNIKYYAGDCVEPVPPPPPVIIRGIVNKGIAVYNNGNKIIN